MTDNGKPLNPSSSAAAAITDPGNPLSSVTVTPSLAEDATGDRNLLRIKVPADNTTLTMGAGTASGFHVSTDKHAAMVAGVL